MGSSSAICCVTNSLISRGDRIAAIIVEQKVKDFYHNSCAEAFYEPLTVFLRGEYDDYGWISPDKDQSEFAVIFNALTNLDLYNLEGSYQVFGALRELGGKDFKSNGRTKKYGDLQVLLMHEHVLDHIYELCKQQTSAELLTKGQAIEARLEAWAESKHKSDFGAGETWNQIRQDQEDLIKKVVMFREHPTLLLSHMLLERHTPVSSTPTPTIEEVLVDERWLRKLNEVGCFYEYHTYYLWRPVSHTTYARTSSMKELVKERLYLVEQAMKQLEESQYEGDVVLATLKVEGLLINLEVNACSFLNELEDPNAYKEAYLNPSTNLFTQLLHSDYKYQNLNWLLLSKYAQDTGALVTGSFNQASLGNYIY